MKTSQTAVAHHGKTTWQYIGKRLAESWQWYLLVLPALVYVLIFRYVPMYGIQIAFKNYRPSKGFWGSPWVGFEHFIRFINYPYFWTMIRNTLAITLLSLCAFPLPIIFALLLNEMENIRLKKTVQMITYIPHFLSEVVVCSLVILFLDRTGGPIPALVSLFGGERVNYLTKATAFPWIYVISDVWQGLGWNSILYISALSAVSPELTEAARVDGANRWHIIWHVNIPCIMPTIIITLIMRMGSLLSIGYSKIYLLQNDLNLDASNVISTYVYEAGVQDGQFSYSTAIGLFNNVINVIILFIANAFARAVSDTSLF